MLMHRPLIFRTTWHHNILYTCTCLKELLSRQCRKGKGALKPDFARFYIFLFCIFKAPTSVYFSSRCVWTRRQKEGRGVTKDELLLFQLFLPGKKSKRKHTHAHTPSSRDRTFEAMPPPPRVAFIDGGRCYLKTLTYMHWTYSANVLHLEFHRRTVSTANWLSK